MVMLALYLVRRSPNYCSLAMVEASVRVLSTVSNSGKVAELYIVLAERRTIFEMLQ